MEIYTNKNEFPKIIILEKNNPRRNRKMTTEVSLISLNEKQREALHQFGLVDNMAPLYRIVVGQDGTICVSYPHGERIENSYRGVYINKDGKILNHGNVSPTMFVADSVQESKNEEGENIYIIGNEHIAQNIQKVFPYIPGFYCYARWSEEKVVFGTHRNPYINESRSRFDASDSSSTFYDMVLRSGIPSFEVLGALLSKYPDSMLFFHIYSPELTGVCRQPAFCGYSVFMGSTNPELEKEFKESVPLSSDFFSEISVPKIFERPDLFVEEEINAILKDGFFQGSGQGHPVMMVDNKNHLLCIVPPCYLERQSIDGSETNKYLSALNYFIPQMTREQGLPHELLRYPPLTADEAEALLDQGPLIFLDPPVNDKTISELRGIYLYEEIVKRNLTRALLTVGLARQKQLLGFYRRWCQEKHFLTNILSNLQKQFAEQNSKLNVNEHAYQVRLQQFVRKFLHEKKENSYLTKEQNLLTEKGLQICERVFKIMFNAVQSSFRTKEKFNTQGFNLGKSIRGNIQRYISNEPAGSFYRLSRGLI